MKHIIIALVFVGLLIGGALYSKNNSNSTGSNATTEPADHVPMDTFAGESIPIMGRNHINVGDTHAPYNSNPPTSGPHAGAAPWGFSEQEIPDENAIHNLEHGGIWITYKNLDDESIGTLRDIARANSQSVVISPRSTNDSSVALSSWGRLMKLDTVDVEEINAFIKSNINNSPEKFAR